MPALTPLLAVPYPVATDPPSGHSQMEAVARALEKAAVVPVASVADRNAKFTAGVLREGSVCFNTATRQLQAYTAGAWATVWTLGDRAYQSGPTPPTASGNPGLIFMDTAKDAIFFSDGSSWIRVTDDTDTRLAKDAFNTANVTTSSTTGSRNPGGAGEPIYADVVAPENGKLLITVCAQMSVTGSGIACLFGSEIADPNTNNTLDGNGWLGAQRSARHNLGNTTSASWTDIRTVASGYENELVRVYGIHAVTDGSATATFISRQITVQPVR